MEFIDFASSPKNILIKAIYTGNKNQDAIVNVKEIVEQYQIKPTLYRLIVDNQTN